MVVAFIPARSGSKSIPFKNIKEMCGKPLIYWSLIALQETESVDEIIVSTDSDEISKIVLSFNLSKVTVFIRSSETATDTASNESAMLESLNTKEYSNDDIFLLVQATSPLTDKNDFSKAIYKFQEENLDSLLTCVRNYRFFWNDDGTPSNYNYFDRPRRQDFSGQLMENGAFYISHVSNILKSGNRLSGKIGIFEMSEETAFEIDEESDWLVVENLLRKKRFNKSQGRIKLFISDVDGVLTDGGMYYSERGDELKKFNTKDGMAFELLRNTGCKTALITSEKTKLVKKRAKKIGIDFLIQGKRNKGKLQEAMKLCKQLDILLDNVVYVGDDLNCKELLENVGYAFCPSDANSEIKKIPRIVICSRKGGEGVIREVFEKIIL